MGGLVRISKWQAAKTFMLACTLTFPSFSHNALGILLCSLNARAQSRNGVFPGCHVVLIHQKQVVLTSSFWIPSAPADTCIVNGTKWSVCTGGLKSTNGWPKWSNLFHYDKELKLIVWIRCKCISNLPYSPSFAMFAMFAMFARKANIFIAWIRPWSEWNKQARSYAVPSNVCKLAPGIRAMGGLVCWTNHGGQVCSRPNSPKREEVCW